MQKEETVLSEEKLKEKARKISVKEGAFSSLMEGFGFRYITPYALAIGASNLQIALLASLPGFIGNFAQLGTLKLLSKFSRKKIVLASVAFQAFMWIPLIFVGWLYFLGYLDTFTSSYILVACYSLLIIAGSIAGPAWSSWMKDILSSDSGAYFSNRNKIITGVVLVSMLISGAILHNLEQKNIFLGFTIIFLIAFLGRSSAAYLFKKKYEPVYTYDKKSAFSLLDFVKHLTTNNFGRFVLFISVISFATSIAGPFFSVYMLKELRMDYFSYTLVLLSPVVATLVFLPAWGKFSDIHGNVRILRIAGHLLPLIPLLWMLSPFFLSLGYANLVFYLFFLEIFSGFVWAGFNHATATFIYDAVTKQKMPYCVAYFNILAGTGALAGALLGGYLASFSYYPFGLTAIFTTFLISAILRIIAGLVFLPWIKEVKPVTEFSLSNNIKTHFKEDAAILTTQFWKLVGFRPVSVRPSIAHY